MVRFSIIKWSIFHLTNTYFDNLLKEIDIEYRTTLINFAKYHLIMFAMAKLMEMTKEEQNQVALFLFNAINSELNKINR